MAGGGNNQMLDMGLMIAAGIAAPELAPALMEGGAAGLGLGATAATAATGAGLGGLAAGVTGQDVAKGALMGGLGGAAAGYFGGVNPADPGSALSATSKMPTDIPMSTVGQDAAGFLPSGSSVSPQIPIDTGGMPYGNMSQTQGIVDAMKPTISSAAPTATSAGLPSLSKASMIGGGVAGINSLLSAPQNTAYVPPNAVYKGGNLQKFKYDPDLYKPDIVTPPSPIYRAQYAEGGIASLAMGGQPGQMYPMSQQEHTNFMDPTQLPASAMAVRNYEPATNPMTEELAKPMAQGGKVNNMSAIDDYISQYNSDPASVIAKAKSGDYNAMIAINKINNTPNQNYSQGGIAQLAVGGKLLRGAGDGMSDNIRANIGGKQEARLADGEFVIPADVVSHLGNGSTDAGAKHLYSMMDRVRKARTGNPKQGKQINPNKYITA